jgi:RNA polymerase sigma-70 factor (ECF subfamily)
MEKKKPISKGKAPLVSQIFNHFIDNEAIIKKFLRRFSSNPHDIDDICQETILRALNAEKNKDIHEPRAFLFGVAKNVARKALDKKSKSLIDFIEDYSDEEYLSNEVPVEKQLDDKQKMVIFWEAVSGLPLQCQRVFVLKKVHGYSHKEIAKQLDISVSTVEKHVAQGLKRSSEYMEKQLGTDTSVLVMQERKIK